MSKRCVVAVLVNGCVKVTVRITYASDEVLGSRNEVMSVGRVRHDSRRKSPIGTYIVEDGVPWTPDGFCPKLLRNAQHSWCGFLAHLSRKSCRSASRKRIEYRVARLCVGGNVNSN